MGKLFANYGIFMAHIEPLKQVEIICVVRKWFHGKYPMHFVIFLVLLTPIQVFGLKTQQEIHESLNTIKIINEFFWTMGKLKILIFYKISRRSNSDKQWRIYVRYFPKLTRFSNNHENFNCKLK